MTNPVRPKHVVVVDAENPLVEIRGEFFWREDHDAILAREREAAFQAGYGEGFAAVTHAAVPQQIRVRYRRPFLRRWLLRLVVAYCVITFGMLIAGMLLEMTSLF